MSQVSRKKMFFFVPREYDLPKIQRCPECNGELAVRAIGSKDENENIPTECFCLDCGWVKNEGT
jgi:uncharacterized protein with PIN domain